MGPRFTRGEYWLLETAVDEQFPVSALMANNLEEYFNKKGHGLTRDAPSPHLLGADLCEK